MFLNSGHFNEIKLSKSKNDKYVSIIDGFIGAMAVPIFLESVLFTIMFTISYLNGGSVTINVNYFGEGNLEMILFSLSFLLSVIWIVLIGFKIFGDTRTDKIIWLSIVSVSETTITVIVLNRDKPSSRMIFFVMNKFSTELCNYLFIQKVSVHQTLN